MSTQAFHSQQTSGPFGLIFPSPRHCMWSQVCVCVTAPAWSCPPLFQPKQRWSVLESCPLTRWEIMCLQFLLYPFELTVWNCAVLHKEWKDLTQTYLLKYWQYSVSAFKLISVQALTVQLHMSNYTPACIRRHLRDQYHPTTRGRGPWQASLLWGAAHGLWM